MLHHLATPRIPPSAMPTPAWAVPVARAARPRLLTTLSMLLALLAALLLARPAAAQDWARNFGTPDMSGQFYAATQATAVDGAGNVYIAGNFNGATLTLGGVTLTRIGVKDVFVAKLDASGTVQWARNYGGVGADVRVSAIAANASSPGTSGHISTDASGNVYLAGYFRSGNLTTPALTRMGLEDAFVVKLNASGATVWARNYGGSGGYADGDGMAVDASGNVYLGGSFARTPLFGNTNLATPVLSLIGNRDAFVVKLNASGTTVWARNYGGGGATTQGSAMAADASGNVYLGGSFNGGNLSTPALTQIGYGDAFVVKLNASGATVWAHNYGGSGVLAIVNAMAADASGNVYLGGYFFGDLSTPALAQIGSVDSFALKLNARGATVWAQNYGGGAGTVPQGGSNGKSQVNAIVNAMAVDASGNLYLGGDFSKGNLTTPVALTLIGGGDAFIIRQAPGAPTKSMLQALSVRIPAVNVLPGITDMASGEGPGFMADMVAMLSNALGQPLQLVEQNAQGTVTLSGYHGGKLAFTPSNYQDGGDPRVNGIYALGDGRYQVVRGGQTLVITPALVHLDQLVALFPGLSATQGGNGVITATVDGVPYAVQPGVQVQSDAATGRAQLRTGSDGAWHFIDAQGNHQVLYPVLADPGALPNAQ